MQNEQNDIMKAKPIMLLTLLLLGILLSREAQAFYNPSTGRWLSRDPIGEKGGVNPYCFNKNDALRHWDYLGLLTGEVSVRKSVPLVSLFSYGWEIELDWIPPAGWDDTRNNCIPCRRAVWVQERKYDIDRSWPWSDEHTGWGNDWNESNFSGSAYEWIAGNRSARNSWMHDEPQVGPRYRIMDVRFEAIARVKCTEGPEKGAIYATVRWFYALRYQDPGPFTDLPGYYYTDGGILSIE